MSKSLVPDSALGRGFRAHRSLGLPKGHFRRLNSFHLHVDGGDNRQLVLDLLGHFEDRGALGKLTPIRHALEGPQRREIPETYASHTPGSSCHEDFEYFSTMSLQDRDDAVVKLKELLSIVKDRPGLVVEIERVAAVIQNGE